MSGNRTRFVALGLALCGGWACNALFDIEEGVPREERGTTSPGTTDGGSGAAASATGEPGSDAGDDDAVANDDAVDDETPGDDDVDDDVVADDDLVVDDDTDDDITDDDAADDEISDDDVLDDDVEGDDVPDDDVSDDDGAGGAGSGDDDAPVGGGGQGGAGGGTGACTEGETVCDTLAGSTRSQCVEGEFQATTPCGSGQVCDPDADGECAVVPDECVGRSPGAHFCEGSTRISCSDTLTDATSETCTSSAHCQASTGAECAPCVEGEYNCAGNQLEGCADDGTGWATIETCGATAPCNADVGACTDLVCLPNQQRCTGDVLEECNSDQSGFDVVDTCDPGLCDPVATECDVCAAGQPRCFDADTVATCASSGQSETQTNCPGGTPYCQAGICVQCTTATHCTGATECTTATCNASNGTCSYAPKTPGTACAGGVCNAQGVCVDCLDASHCTPTNACYTPSCSNGTCSEAPITAGTPCNFAGGSVCSAGNCVECINNGMCTPLDACHTASCNASNQCVDGFQPPGTSCTFSGGNVCNSEGGCVECVDLGDCTASNACYEPTCALSQCGETPRIIDTPCSFSGGTRCNGEGACVPCTANGHCMADNVCRDWACVNAIANVGWDAANGTAQATFADYLYIRRLPQLAYDAELRSLAIFGTATGASARIALYADNGSGTSPVGQPLAETGVLAMAVGARVGAVTPQPALSANTYYWIAFKLNAGPNVGVMTGGPTVDSTTGRYLTSAGTGLTFGDEFYDFPGTASPGTGNSTAFSVYAVIEHVE